MEVPVEFRRPRNLVEFVDFGKRASEAFIGRSHLWVAGDRLEDGMRIAKETNAAGQPVLINQLGERYHERETVEAAAREYLRLGRAIRAEGVRGALSVKPTQFGLLIDREYARSKLQPLVDAMKADGGRVLWLDMETAETTDDTLWLFERLRESYDRVGLTVQANLRRTSADLDRLLEGGARIRLVKGAYRETPDIALRARSQIDDAFLGHLETLFARAQDFAVATHDERMVRRAQELGRDHGARFEFAMLWRVQDALRAHLARQGYRVAVYLSYGAKWFPYFARGRRERLRELVALARAALQEDTTRGRPPRP